MSKPKTAPEITAEQRLTVVRHLAHGRGLDFTAAATHLDADTVREIGVEHGWPREESLAKAADVLARRLDADAKATMTPRPDLEVVAQNNRPSGQTRREMVARASESDRTGQRPVTIRQSDDRQLSGSRQFDATAALLLRGRESGKKRTQNLAERISDQLTDLRDRLDEEDRERRAQEKLEAEKAEARVEVERLERELAEAKARARSHNKGYARTRNVQERTSGVRPARKRTVTYGDFPCDVCGRHFDTKQGLTMHNTRVHREAS